MYVDGERGRKGELFLLMATNYQLRAADGCTRSSVPRKGLRSRPRLRAVDVLRGPPETSLGSEEHRRSCGSSPPRAFLRLDLRARTVVLPPRVRPSRTTPALVGLGRREIKFSCMNLFVVSQQISEGCLEKPSRGSPGRGESSLRGGNMFVLLCCFSDEEWLRH